MRRFDIITEADARVLPRGETVLLARGGHVTPLARDTLAERRVTVVLEGRIPDEDRTLAGAVRIGSLAVASDEAGTALRRDLVAFARGLGLAVQDLDPGASKTFDYVEAAREVGERVARGEADAGVVIDARGIGAAIAANKIPGIRAAAATTEAMGRDARQHYGANVLTLGAALVIAAEARAIVTAWLGATTRDPAEIRRLAAIRDLERDAARGGGR